jgi:hypothetical protein
MQNRELNAALLEKFPEEITQTGIVVYEQDLNRFTLHPHPPVSPG